MVKVEILGSKKIEKGGKSLYYLSCLAKDTEKGTEGLTTYNGFVSEDHLKKNGIDPTKIVGLEAKFYTVKDGNVWKSGITFKNT